MLARQYLDYRDAMDKIGTDYLDCPVECPKSPKRFDPGRAECDECPRAYQKRVFRQQYNDAIGERFEEKAKDFPFEKMLEKFYSVLAIEDRPDSELTPMLAALVSAYRSEVNRARRIEEAARPTSMTS
jgi:hypothetical protein